MNISSSRILAAGSALLIAAGLSACSSSEKATSEHDHDHDHESHATHELTYPTLKDGEKLEIATSFYPLLWMVEKIGADNVEATSITPTNAEPHDYELSPKEIADLDKKHVLVYVSGFQPSLDDAADTLTATSLLDLNSTVKLEVHEGLEGHSHVVTDENGNKEVHTHGAEEGASDPHFWLDPVRMKDAAGAVTDYLVKTDPAHADAYKANGEKLQAELDKLNSDFSSKLGTCERKTLVTTHTAFGYLAERYGLKQLALSGVDPEAEPSPAVLAKVKEFIKKDGTTTIFTEELLSPKTAEALAKEAGIGTAVLAPMESQPEAGDYLSAMESNLTEITKALGCK